MGSIDNRLAALAGSHVFLTGGAGLIGRQVRAQLLEAGASVSVLDNLSAADRDTYALCGVNLDSPDLAVGSVHDTRLVAEHIARADYVVHAAAHSTVAGCLADPDTAFASNIAGTETVLRAAARSPRLKRLVFLSSAQVYGHGSASRTHEQVFTEDAPAQPLNLYASAKLWGEAQTRFLLNHAGVDYTVLRPFSVYGPGQIPKPKAFNWAIAQLSMYAAIGDPLPLNHGGRQVRDFLHVTDAATGILHALTAPAASRQTLNLGAGRTTSIRQVAEMIQGHFPHAKITDGASSAQDPLGGRADITAMAEALGWEPKMTVADGIADFVTWLHDTPAAIPGWLREEGGAQRLAAWRAVDDTARAARS
ncbi:NAD-dependent epimerase/dehydratase family protein [Streptomyces sp. NPDC048496]|uniref:NAD-dependent epimerase/dehydratase family protein n=1 Tax=Streptomyces sp. NPDC048496 TaxID=3365558 RepID=UPI003716D906